MVIYERFASKSKGNKLNLIGLKGRVGFFAKYRIKWKIHTRNYFFIMINSNIGNYTIIRLIGEGGMASVYEAGHEMLGTKVANKVL